ncbi:DUF1049 domain-containing protein [bacterium]|nr:DUF1049 domain-containing protein [bacterium]
MQTLKKILRILVYVVIFSLFLLFAMYNNEKTATVDFLVWKTPIIPLWMLVFISLILGLVLGLVLVTGAVFSANKEKKQLQKEIKKIKDELNRMRNANIEEEVDTENEPVKDDSANQEA